MVSETRVLFGRDGTEEKSPRASFQVCRSQIPNSNDTSMGTAGMGEVIKLRTRSSDSVLRYNFCAGCHRARSILPANHD